LVRSAIEKAFNIYSTLVNEAINTGKHAFTGEDVEYTASQKRVIKKFMDMDLSNLTPKQAIEAVDSLHNFLQNKSTAKMETVLAQYDAEVNSNRLVQRNIKAQKLSKYWSPSLARLLASQITTMPVLFERMFKGFKIGGEVMDAMGLTKLMNGKSKGQAEANKIVNDYVNKFYKQKANGEKFNTEYNHIERGIASFMSRNFIGTEEEMNKEFRRRKDLLVESIKRLSNGNEKEKKKAEIYQKAFDKVVKDSNNIQDIQNNTDAVNLEAVKFWNDEWSSKYDDMSDVALNVYNKVLDRNLNYNPDKYSKLSSDIADVQLDDNDSAFFNNSGLYQNESGPLTEANYSDNLPKGTYIDLSFDKNMSNSMYDALIDINTAAAIKQVNAFLNSDNFNKIFPDADDARILKGKNARIKEYVNNIRGKSPYNIDEVSTAVKRINRIATLGVGQALGGIFQPAKQVVSVAFNTMINTKGRLDLGAMFDPDKRAFILNSGQSIANRGAESQAQIESINKLLDTVANSKGDKLVKAIEDLNKLMLKIFLVKPDVYIARSSWLSYYEKALRDSGVDTNGLDYKTHELNEDAANYATRMVDRQQNVSDAELSGKIFSSKNTNVQALTKMFMPFASFRMNQSARLGADLATLMSKTSTEEDKKIARTSVAGFAVEMAVFRALSAGIAISLGYAVKSMMGKEDDEEEVQKTINNIMKGQATGTFTDIFSPLPILDKPIQTITYSITDKVQEALDVAEEERVNIFDTREEGFIKSLGTFGIAAERASQLFDVGYLSTVGKFKDDYGKTKTISDDDKETLGMLFGPALLSNIGLAPTEVNSIVRSAIKEAKKDAKGESTSKGDVIEKLQNKQEKQEDREDKVDVLKKLLEKETDEDKISIINEEIDDLQMSDEQRKIERKALKEERKAEKDEIEKLLGGYDNKSDLKRYNPSLYEQNFGPYSEYYLKNKDEIEVKAEARKLERSMKDQQYGYGKSNKSYGYGKKNSDGSRKRSSRSY
jgi:hypothetical protein